MSYIYSKEEATEELERIEEQLGNAVEDLFSLIRNLGLTDSERARIFHPDFLGNLSRILCRGEGCEPAFTNAFTLENIRTICERLESAESDEDEFEDDSNESDLTFTITKNDCI